MNLKRSWKKFWKGFLNILGKFWFLIWKDDSLKGWVFGLAFLFIFIKFIFFPTLSLVTGTEIPLAIVESCSMYHKGNLLSNFDNWWEGHENKYEPYIINQLDFQDFIFKRGLNKGDILFIIRATPEKLEVGDVVIFNGAVKYPIIHRIIKIEHKDGEYIFQTIGDNNNQQLSLETNIKEEQLVGKAVFKIAPYLGWGKLIFFEANKPASERGLCREN